MKKSLLALAALGAFAGVAHAQSSVTLYGIVDEGFNINTNAGGKHLYNLTSGVLQGSRWGMRGNGGPRRWPEAQSSCSKTALTLNSGKAGQGGLLFGRQVLCRSVSSKFGSVTLGRQYDSAG